MRQETRETQGTGVGILNTPSEKHALHLTHLPPQGDIHIPPQTHTCAMKETEPAWSPTERSRVRRDIAQVLTRRWDTLVEPPAPGLHEHMCRTVSLQQ